MLVSSLAIRVQPFVCVLLIAGLLQAGQGPPHRESRVTLTLAEQRDTPVIRRGDPGTEQNKYGFEGGCVIKQNGVYHLFTSEMVGDPFWVKMKLGHWTSSDRLKWTRRDTMYESSGDTTGKDPRAALWAPMPVWDPNQRLWNLFYVAYHAPTNWDGRICRAVSKTLDGPWKDIGVVLERGPASDWWEDKQGTDSFFAFPAGGRWLGFYGSSDTKSWWKVGLAEASTLAGPWRRLSKLNPVALSGDLGTENPVVTRLPSGRYVAVFDTIRTPYAIGYADSSDGIHWPEARQLQLEQRPALWVGDVRTVLGLIEEPDGTFTLFYTGYEKSKGKQGYGCLGLLRVRVAEQ